MEIPVLIVPPSTQHTHTVIFLHGRGDNARQFATSLNYSRDSCGRTLSDSFPSFRWVFPQAETRDLAASPGSKMMQWFDIWNVTNFAEKEELQAGGLRESVASIRRILANEAALLGGHWNRIVLAGISQGAATSVHTLLNLGLPSAGGEGEQAPRRLAAFMGFSCRMPFPGRTLAGTRKVLGLDGTPDDDELLRNTPVLLEHCVDDPLVLVGNGRALRDTLTGFGAQVTWKEYPNGGHWFNAPAGMDDVVEFVNKHVLGTASARGSFLIQAQTLSDAMDLS